MAKTETEVKDLKEIFKETKGYVLLPSGKGFDVFECEIDTLKAMFLPQIRKQKAFMKTREIETQSPQERGDSANKMGDGV